MSTYSVLPRAEPSSSAFSALQSTTTTASSTNDLPLSGVRVLDLSRVLAGPFCTQILADYGADVLKVEQPGTGDETRQWRAAGEGQKWQPEHKLMSLYFASINRNKRSVTINLKSPKGVEIVKKLAQNSDVVVNNFVPGKMEQMGLGYEDFRKINPAIIYASCSGYGASGPSRDRAGYDAIALAEAGMLHITGDPKGGPTKPGVAMADLCTGLYIHGAILAALNQRNRTGVGCQIEGSLFESALSLLINVGLAALNLDVDKGPEQRRRGKRMGLGHPNLVPYGAFKTKDGMIFVAANNNRQWKGLCKRMGMEELGEDQRFNTNDGRVENREELNNTLQNKFLEKTQNEWLAVFKGSGLPYGSINDVVDALEHPQAEARNMVLEIDEFEAAKDGALKLIGPAMKFSGAKMGVRLKPPVLGQHTDEVLKELGYGSADISELKKSGIV
ncbi:CoA-transferase family III domain-containing protein [Exophiala viscosa]|uniref:CoA-transferase family III domain-containing protein n=1 Tax=Exophiala viscosa TaxID=2486360 RepID=A0AAN6I9A8_9EURO|nr:CoA-transferase family III domain-containing protein [Exophiala viscosa]KAI1620820.1 CoA-transferase family III domain-containing protein [Exophiala viscosa]